MHFKTTKFAKVDRMLLPSYTVTYWCVLNSWARINTLPLLWTEELQNSLSSQYLHFATRNKQKRARITGLRITTVTILTVQHLGYSRYVSLATICEPGQL